MRILPRKDQTFAIVVDACPRRTTHDMGSSMKERTLPLTILVLTCLLFGSCDQEPPPEPYQNAKEAIQVVAGTNPVVSAFGAELAFIRSNQLFLCDTAGVGVAQITDGSLSAYSPKWSPDGQTIGFVQEDPINWQITKLMKIDAPTRAIGRLSISDTLPWHSGSGYSWEWSPDNQKVAMIVVSSGMQYLKVIKADGSGEMINQYPATQFSWNPDGTKLVCANQTDYDTSYVYIATLGQDSLVRVSTRTFATSVQWLPNSNVILYESWPDGLMYYDLDSKSEIKKFIVNDAYQLSPDGVNIGYYYYWRNSNPDGEDSFSIYNLNTLTNVTTFLVSSNTGLSFVWAPSSKQIFYTFNGNIYKINVPR